MALRSLKQRVGLAALVATIIGLALGALAWAVDPPDATATATVTGPATVTAAQGRTTNLDLAGRTLPFIFRVTDGNGKRVTTLTGADVSVVASFGVCGTGASFPVRLYGASGLVALPGGWYLDSFKTQTSWAGQCATITVSTPYGGSRSANFRFT